MATQTAAVAASSGASAQASQTGLVLAMAPEITAALSRLDTSSLRDSLPALTALMALLARRYGAASATLAARQYRAERRAAGVPGRYTVKPAGLPPLQQVTKTVDWATQPLWSPEPDLTTTEKRLTAAMERLTLDVGRQTIVDNSLSDRQAKGWARVPEPGACSFCALLATRGMSYRSEGTADFLSHTNCRCHAEAIFTAYEPSAQIREWQALYRESTRGLSGAAARNAFRQALEGRTT